MKKVKIGNIISIAIVIVFIMNIIRNYVIITILNNKAINYVNSNNYYANMSTFYNGEIRTINDYYKKNNNELSVIRSKLRIIKLYNKNNRKNFYMKSEKERLCKLDSQKELLKIEIREPIENTFKVKFLESLFSIIYTDSTDTIKCYKLCSLFDKRKIYINKENGLIVREQLDKVDRKIKYEFNNVMNEVFNEPDIKEYIVVK